MKNLLLFGVLALCLNSYGQSKKQQIVALNYSIDSLNVILSITRNEAAKDIGGLNKTIGDLSKEIAQLKSDVSSLEKDKAKLTRENEKLKTDLEDMSKKNLELEEKLKAHEHKDITLHLVDDFGIGKIKLGMTMEEINTFCETEIIVEGWNEMGEFDSQITCKLDNSVITAGRNEQFPKAINVLSTESDQYETSKGFHTGMPVSKLKELYSVSNSSGEGARGVFIEVEELSKVKFLVSVKNESRNNLRNYNYWDVSGDNLPDDLIIDTIVLW